jgi:hypothetical protein
VSFDPGSNVNDRSDLHDAKQFSPRNPTGAGIQIDSNDEQPANALAPISVSFEPASNLRAQRKSH